MPIKIIQNYEYPKCFIISQITLFIFLDKEHFLSFKIIEHLKINQAFS